MAYDAVVCGAGPAGVTVASLLRGRRVAVLDSNPFYRPCGELVRKALEQERLLITVTRERTIRLLPPLVCDESQIDEIAVRVRRLLH